MGRQRALLGLTTALIAALLLFACGQSSSRDTSVGTHRTSINLSDALAELDAMQAPASADAAVFAQLKEALRAALIARSKTKIACAPPTGDANIVPDVALTDNGDGTYNVNWHYYNLGDYNQDGAASVADITPLAMNFGQIWTVGQENTLTAVIDGSGNGIVDIADVTPIAMNFGVECASYDIETSDTENGTYTLVQPVSLTAGADEDTVRMWFSVDITPAASIWYRVVPYDSGSSPGVPSKAVQLGAPVASIVPDDTSGIIPFTVNFNASASYDDDGAIVKYEWDFEGDGTFDLDTGNTPSASYVYTVAGNYNAAMRVTDNDGFQDMDSTAITAKATPIAPTASIVPDIDKGAAPLSVYLDASASSDVDGIIVKYEWDLNEDGVFELDSGTKPFANYTYTDFGSYHPAVRVTDNDGLQATANATVTVSFASWVHTWGQEYEEVATGVDINSLGNIYMSGSSDIGSLIALYSPSGDLEWIRSFSTTGIESKGAEDIAIDSGDNILLCGGYSDSAGNTDALLIKLDSAGAIQWQESFGGAATDYTFGVDTDDANNIYVAGYTESTSTPGAMVTKFDPSGNMLWNIAWSLNGGEWAYSLAVDGPGNVYVVIQTTELTDPFDYDAALLKLDTNGNPLWQKRWDKGYWDRPWDVAIDGSDHVYLVGSTGSGANVDAFLVKYDSTGSLLSQWIYDAGKADYFANVIADKGSDDVYASGFRDRSGYPYREALVVKFDAAGSLVEQETWGESAHVQAYGIALGNDGALCFVGVSPNASITRTGISGSASDALGTSSDISGVIEYPDWLPYTLSGGLSDQSGVIDTGGGHVSDLLIAKENPLFW